MLSFFTSTLLQWHREINKRSMPWKGEKDPYKIWLSEIILQQTRVEQGLAYYNRFIEAFPDVHALAIAPEQTVFKLWEGLGYYSRCKNLIASARFISQESAGKFPSDYEGIASLKGVGPYTAAAISSFAFGLPHAVVDGNVLRVLARFLGIATPVFSTEGKKQFFRIANELIDRENPAEFNQAIMDFGATVCKPRQPLCPQCMLAKDCKAFQEGLVNDLPVKTKAAAKRKRWLNYFILKQGKHTFIRQRPAGDIWENLFEFYLHESDHTMGYEELVDVAKSKITGASVDQVSELYVQQLSHQEIASRFILLSLPADQVNIDGYQLVLEDDLPQYAFPRIITRFLEKGFTRQLGLNH
jgi:A/G-specific adenine glycosylase